MDDLDDFNDDALAEMAEEMRAEGKKLLDMAERARYELVNRMVARGATHLDEHNWGGKLAPGAMDHTVDDERMLLLREMVGQTQWARVLIIPPAPKPRWNHSELNELAKLGGTVGEIITGARTTERARPTLTLSRKEGK